MIICVGALTLLARFFEQTLSIGKDELNGVWCYDEVTSYEFDGNGDGALVLPSAQYAFRYEIDETHVSIDFEDDAANDASYDFLVESDVLTLKTGQGEDEIIYVLQKSE